MKVLVIGDPMLTSSELELAVKKEFQDAEVFRVDWKPRDDEEFWFLRSEVEAKGPSAGKPPQEIFDFADKVELIITQHTPLDARVISAAKSCKLIGVCRAGVENIDVEAASHAGIAVFHTMGRNANAVSDYTIGLMLAEMRNIARGHAELRQGNWKKKYANADFVGEMLEKKVGLVGFGYIGRLVAEKLRNFHVDLLVYDPYADPDAIRCEGGKPVSLEELCREADFISMHARLSEATQGMIGTKEFSLMKPTAYIINTARAGLIDEQALVTALQEKKIGGAGIDVFWIEPPPKDHPLMTLPNVTITPHLAGSTKDAFRRTPYLLMAEICRTLEDGTPRWVVNDNEISVDYKSLRSSE